MNSLALILVAIFCLWADRASSVAVLWLVTKTIRVGLEAPSPPNEQAGEWLRYQHVDNQVKKNAPFAKKKNVETKQWKTAKQSR